MPGRIRSIKPELVEDSVVGRLSHPAFRLLVASVTTADDYGNQVFDPARLRATAFWAVDADVDACVNELFETGLWTKYKVQGDARTFLHVAGWEQGGDAEKGIPSSPLHQKVDRPSRPRVPRCPDPSGPDPRPDPTRERTSPPRGLDEDSTQAREDSRVSEKVGCVDVKDLYLTAYRANQGADYQGADLHLLDSIDPSVAADAFTALFSGAAGVNVRTPKNITQDWAWAKIMAAAKPMRTARRAQAARAARYAATYERRNGHPPSPTMLATIEQHVSGEAESLTGDDQLMARLEAMGREDRTDAIGEDA
jgi:hypothetical protein